MVGGDGTKKAPTGDVFDQPSDGMISVRGKLADHVGNHVVLSPEGAVLGDLPEDEIVGSPLSPSVEQLLNLMAPVRPLGKLRWFEGCHYIQDREMSALTMSHKTFAVELVRKFCVTFELSVPLRVGVRLGVW